MVQEQADTAPYFLASRPMTEAEEKALINSLKPKRYNAIAFSVIAIITAILVNFSYYEEVVLVPLLFIVISAGTAAEYRKNFRAARETLTRGYILEIRGMPMKKRFRGGWAIGPTSIAKFREVATRLTE